MFNCFDKTPKRKCSILPPNCDAQLPEFVVTPLSPIGFSEWVVMMINCFVVWLTDERRLVYFRSDPLPEILTIANLQHAACRTWTSMEPKFRLCWMKLCSSDNHYTTAPRYYPVVNDVLCIRCCGQKSGVLQKERESEICAGKCTQKFD